MTVTSNNMNNYKIFIESKIKDNAHISSIGFMTLAGSHAYGISTPNSDIDVRGFALPVFEDIMLLHDFEQIESSDGIDLVLYSFNKFVKLLLAGNPNVLEQIGVDESSIICSSYAYELLIENTDVFLSQQCFKTFGGYATAQLRRIQNAMNRNGSLQETNKSKQRSIQSVIDSFGEKYTKGNYQINCFVNEGENIFCDIDMKNVPLEDVSSIFHDIDHTNKTLNKMYNADKRENCKLAKHASHLIRLIRMGTEILSGKGIKTMRTEDANFLLDIKNGKWLTVDDSGKQSFDDAFWDLVDYEEERFEYAAKNSSLPEKPNVAKARELVCEIHGSIKPL